MSFHELLLSHSCCPRSEDKYGHASMGELYLDRFSVIRMQVDNLWASFSTSHPGLGDVRHSGQVPEEEYRRNGAR